MAEKQVFSRGPERGTTKEVLKSRDNAIALPEGGLASYEPVQHYDNSYKEQE